MTTRLTFPASMFSVVCQRCGSTMRKNADSCPNCGADRNAALGAKRESGQIQSSASMFEQTASASAGASIGGAERAEPTLRPGWPAWDAKRASERIAQKAAEYRARRAEAHARSAYADSGSDPDALPGSRGWTRKRTLIAGACGVVLLAGAAFYLQLGDSDSDDAPSTEHSVSGAIDSKVGPLVRGAIDTANTAIAPATPSAPAPQARRAPAGTRALAPGDALTSVRVALDQHDLVAARTRLKALPTQQQARPEYETLKDELVKRELQRDAALQLARACERTSAWTCVQQNAGEALALDGGNAESQAMLERVISHAGWLAPTASAALARKAPSAAPGTGATTADQTAPATAANAAPGPVIAAPAPAPGQANVAAAPQAAKPGSPAQKSADRQHAGQRSAAARGAADDVDAGFESRAQKFARGQAATNAITAATIGPSTPPSVATTTTTPTPTPTTPTPTPTPAAPQPQPQPQPQSTAQSAAQSPAQTAVRTQAAPAAQAAAPRAPYYLGEEAKAPASSGTHGANARAPYYIGDEAAQPAARPGGVRTPYYLGEDPPQQTAPAPRSAAPRPPQSTGQSSSLEPSAATTAQAAMPRQPAASAQPVATVVAQPSAQPGTPAGSAQPVAAASPQFATTPAGGRLDSDKSEELERAIKQYGWSNSDPAKKPSQ
jgi:hypothetical protein